MAMGRGGGKARKRRGSRKAATPITYPPMQASRFEAPAPEGSRPPKRGEPGRPPGPEPIVNAPWPVVALTVAIIGLYLLQSLYPLAWVADSYAFSPHLIAAQPERLLTSLFVHGAWAHALLNAAFILAFGAPVARLFGPRLGGVVAFFAFYLACGVLATLGFAALHWGQAAALIGASGAASGLMGAAARLIGGRGQVGPIFSQAVTGMGLAWLLINAIMALAPGGLVPGVGPTAAVGWEAHLAGFAAGVLLIGPFGRLAARR